VRVGFNVLVFLLVYIPLSWASGIDYSKSPPVDFPTLAIREVYDTPEMVTRKCAALGSYGSLACATPDFGEGVCTIYLPRDPPQWMVTHERAHCAGYDHHGDDIIRKDWEVYKKGLLELRPK
jgi:hypothetical protein